MSGTVRDFQGCPLSKMPRRRRGGGSNCQSQGLTLDQKPSLPMISRTVLLPAAMPPPSSKMTGCLPGSSFALFMSSNISCRVMNLQRSAAVSGQRFRIPLVAPLPDILIARVLTEGKVGVPLYPLPHLPFFTLDWER